MEPHGELVADYQALARLFAALGSELRLQFKGKGGRLHEAGIQDPQLLRLVRAMHELPGQRLFQYRDEDGELAAVESSDVNAYLRDCMGGDFTAKDFRTWGATEAAFRQLAAIACEDAVSDTAAAGVCRDVCTSVAGLLGNTPAVCRKSYIDPRVFDRYQDGATLNTQRIGGFGKIRTSYPTLHFRKSG